MFLPGLVLLRDLDFDIGENVPMNLPFLNDALETGKFRFVKQLSVPSIYSGSDVYRALLEGVAPFLEHLSISFGTLEEFTPLLDAITMQTVGMARSVAWLWPGTLKKVPRNRVKGRQSDWSDYS